MLSLLHGMWFNTNAVSNAIDYSQANQPQKLSRQHFINYHSASSKPGFPRQLQLVFRSLLLLRCLSK
jgi:hypothetical protein